MACTNTVKPDVVSRPTNIYGAPQGQAGRTFDGNDFGIQAIILHCTDMTISQYVQYLACLSQPVLNTSEETTHHYSIGSAGALNQHIADGNISWTFGAYGAQSYPNAPAPTRTIQWQTLQDLNGANVSPDVYAVNILIAKSYNQGTTCLTSSGLPGDQHDKLLQLIAYLVETYNIPVDADHIQWHDNIATQACPSNECNCTDLACLIRDINAYCDNVDDCNKITYTEVDCDMVGSLLAVPDNCANSSGCVVSVPFDACCFGHLPQPGDIEQFVGCAVDLTTGKTCLVKNVVQVTAPITGEGTAANPLALSLCDWDTWVPILDPTDPATMLFIGDDGCLYQSPLENIVPGMETPVAVIDTNTVDLTSTGTNGHTIQADVKISTATGNILTSDASGLLVTIDCTNLAGLFEDGTITGLYGFDEVGNCVSEPAADVVNGIICTTLIDDGAGEPMHILGRDIDLTCPVFYTPTQVVFAGLAVEDTLTVDLTMVQDPAVSPLNIIRADVIIDPAADNVLQVTPDGLYVAPIQAQAGDTCLDVQVVNGVITISHIIDPKAENILQCGPDGLCVLDIIAVDTDCFDMTYDAVTREVSGAIIFAPDQDNISNVAECISGEGFYVPRGARLLANEPLVGDGSEVNPLDIDFSLMDNQDLCDFGGVIPETLSLVNVIGTDANDCLRLYTGEQFIAQFLEIANGDCIRATLTDNVLNIEPVISPAIGGFNNVLSCTPTGLFVPIGAGISVNNTNCIEMQFTNGVMTSTITLDPNTDNQVTCNEDGLFVPRGSGVTGTNTDCIGVTVIDGVVSATPILSGAIAGISNVLTCEPGGQYVPLGAGIVPTATDCMTIELNGTTGELTIEPIISPLVDNIIECTANGLYVPGNFIQAMADTDCIALAVVGNELTASPIIDPDLDNLLECRETGLFAQLNILDTACINVEITNGVISVEPIIDPKVTNLLECGIDGLLVELDPDVFIDSDCINFDVTNGLVTAEPILAPDQGPLTNVLQCLPDGLFVPVAAGLTVLDGSCVELQLVNGLLTAEVTIDPDVDNAITCGPDGLFVEICCPLVEDTNTVDLTLNDPRTITADVIIDPDGTNILVANPDGLYVPPPFITAAVDSNCLDIEVTDGILTINPIISAEPDNVLQCLADGLHVPECCPLVLDTTSIDLTLTGDRTISGVVIIDPSPDNILVINPDGLFVPPQFIDAVANTQCMELLVTDGVLTATPVVDPDPLNGLTCGPAGLFVDPCCPIVTDTNTVDLTLTGTREISADVIIDPLADNILVVNAEGLYVPPVFVQAVNNTACIILDVTGNVLTATPVIDPDVTNQLTCGVAGLFVPPAGGITTADTDCIAVDITGTEITATAIISGPIGAINNALQCTDTGLYVPVDFISAVAPTDCINVQVIDGALIINPVLDPAADNLLSCGAAGLYVPPVTVVDTNCIDLDLTTNVLTANVIISTQANNIVDCVGDGLFAEAPVRTVADTDCIALVLNNGELTATPIIDSAADNQLVCNATGLYVPEPFITAVNDTQCVTLDVTGGVLTATPILDPAADNLLTCGANGLLVEHLITVVDTNCIDLDLTANVLTANPIISATVDNQVDCIGDGFYVPKGAGLEVLDTNCFDFSITNGVITGSPIISGNAGNIITCETDGLYVPEDFITAVGDTNCITLTETAGVLTADPIISALADNTIVCQGDGLYVPSLVVNDTNCITLDLTGGVLTASPILSATADNQVQCIGDGLYVPQGGGLVGLDTDCLSTTVTAGEVSVDPIIAGTQAGIANSLICIAGEGLYVPAGADLIAIDGNCIDLTLTNGNILQAEVIVDPAADNLLTCNLAAGLYVPPLIGATSNCVTVDVTNNIATVDLILAPTQGLYDNITSCLADGLFTPETLFTRNLGASAAGGNTIDVDTDGDGLTDFTFCEGFCEIVSTNDCVTGVGTDYAVKQFSIADDVLTIESAADHTSVSVAGVQVTGNGPGAPSAVINEITDQFQTTLTITNPSLCRSMEVTVTADMVMNYSTPTAGGQYACMFRLNASSLGGATVAILAPRALSPLPAGIINFGQAASLSYTEVLAPGASVTYTAINQTFIATVGFPAVSTANAIQINASGHTI